METLPWDKPEGVIQDGFLPFRQSAYDALLDMPLPTRKTEDWKYTSLSDLPARIALDTATETSDLSGISIQLGGQNLTLGDSSLPEGLDVRAISDFTYDELVELGFGKVKPNRHYFGRVNDLCFSEGLVIRVLAGHSIDALLQLSHQFKGRYQAHHRVFILVESDASLTFQQSVEGESSALFSQATEVVLQDRAHFCHLFSSLSEACSYQVNSLAYQLNEASRLEGYMLMQGAEMKRVDCDVIYQAEHAKSLLNTAYLTDRDENLDFHSCIEHALPNCVTEQNVRGVASGRSSMTFNGRIHIHRDAQKTLAELNNRNLLMSEKAQINTKPELEIYADDVRCAHGATVAELDEASLYYLSSRGIDAHSAKLMLTYGFVKSLFDGLDEALSAYVYEALETRFERMVSNAV